MPATARLIQDAYAKLRDCNTLVVAATCLVEIGDAIRMPHPGVIDDYSAQRMLTIDDGRLLTTLMGWDTEPVRQWFEQKLHLVSPLAAVCRISTRPFAWDAETVATAVAGAGRGRTAFEWPLTPARGFYGGITVPVHMPRGRTGSVSWYSKSPAVDIPAVLEAHADVLRLAAHRFMDLVYAVRRERIADPDPCHTLSEREIECLTWAALGRTDAEIGSVLNRSPTTARFHMDNAVRKLGARNRTQAVAIAIQRGLIQPVDGAVASIS
jgi:DNA-binding CsgD family transcriptional regulator